MLIFEKLFPPFRNIALYHYVHKKNELHEEKKYFQINLSYISENQSQNQVKIANFKYNCPNGGLFQLVPLVGHCSDQSLGHNAQV